MKKDQVVLIDEDGGLINKPTSTFIKHALRFCKPHRYFSENFGQDEKLEIWTRKFLGTEYLYQRKQRSGGFALEFNFKSKFKKEDVENSTSSCSEYLNDFSSIPPGLLENCAPINLFRTSIGITSIPEELFEDKPNSVRNPNIKWINDQWFDESKLIETGYSELFSGVFFLTENGTLLRKVTYGSFNCESSKPIYNLASAKEVYNYECWKMRNDEDWVTQMNPNPNNAL